MKKIIACFLLLAVMLSLIACNSNVETSSTYGPLPDNLDFTVNLSGIKKGGVSSGISVHDPSILEANGTFYIYGSHMTAARGNNLLRWKMIGDGYNRNNAIYGQIYDVYDEAFAWSGAPTSLNPTDDANNGGGEHVWAPDVIYNETTGLYYMYYCTTSTWNCSNLCFGTSETPDGEFQWQATILYSGFGKRTIQYTDVFDYVDEYEATAEYLNAGGSYNYKEYPNALDPSVFFDADGRMWMVYGSWSGGIYLLELDPATGLVIHPEDDPANDVDTYFGKKLLGGQHKSIEAPYILYAGGYYYLFVSYGSLNRDGGYQIRVFRSETPDGQYVDMNGETPYGGGHAAYGLKLSGNYNMPSVNKAYKATGHNSAIVASDGRMYVVYHTRFDDGTEYHSPRVHQFLLNEEGWICMLPYQTQGESVSPTGYEKSQVAGRYYVINQGTDISKDVAEPFILYFLEDGRVAGEDVSGFWTCTDGTYYMHFTLGEQEYSGVFCQMPDEAGTTVMTFSAVGNNESVWGVKYD